MRRSLSISLLVLFLLGPLITLLPGLDESRLPACCRRHGLHHCAMDAGTVQLSPGEHAAYAPAQCPLFRTVLPATLPAFLPAAQPMMERFTATLVTPSTADAAPVYRPQTHASRGPPAGC